MKNGWIKKAGISGDYYYLKNNKTQFKWTYIYVGKPFLDAKLWSVILERKPKPRPYFKEFKTKQQAVKFALNYIKKHPFG